MLPFMGKAFTQNYGVIERFFKPLCVLLDMSNNLVESGLDRLKLMYLKKGNPIKGRSISNYEKMCSYMRHRMNGDLAPDTLLNDVKALIEFSKVINKPFKELTSDDIYELFSYLNSKSKGTAGLYKLKISCLLYTSTSPRDG